MALSDTEIAAQIHFALAMIAKNNELANTKINGILQLLDNDEMFTMIVSATQQTLMAEGEVSLDRVSMTLCMGILIGLGAKAWIGPKLTRAERTIEEVQEQEKLKSLGHGTSQQVADGEDFERFESLKLKPGPVN